LLTSCQLRKLQKSDVADQFHFQNQRSQDDSSIAAQEEIPEVPYGNDPPEDDSNAPSCLEPTYSSADVPLFQTEEELKEIWAATIIQTAFRAFLVCIHVMWIPFSDSILSSNIPTNPNTHSYAHSLFFNVEASQCLCLRGGLALRSQHPHVHQGGCGVVVLSWGLKA
jgi:hypothetical protein